MRINPIQRQIIRKLSERDVTKTYLSLFNKTKDVDNVLKSDRFRLENSRKDISSLMQSIPHSEATDLWSQYKGKSK